MMTGLFIVWEMAWIGRYRLSWTKLHAARLGGGARLSFSPVVDRLWRVERTENNPCVS